MIYIVIQMKVYLELSKTSKRKLFTKILNGFQEKAPSLIFGWVLNTSLTMVTHTEAQYIVIPKTLKHSLEVCFSRYLIVYIEKKNDSNNTEIGPYYFIIYFYEKYTYDQWISIF